MEINLPVNFYADDDWSTQNAVVYYCINKHNLIFYYKV